MTLKTFVLVGRHFYAADKSVEQKAMDRVIKVHMMLPAEPELKSLRGSEMKRKSSDEVGEIVAIQSIECSAVSLEPCLFSWALTLVSRFDFVSAQATRSIPLPSKNHHDPNLHLHSLIPVAVPSYL